ncbi:hypothetical protein PJ912_27735 [Pectobacterium colocasium]|uniref:hypothetical protein n=1 Tax=Pectobacterium TaxID=122277 RepID=UPI003D72B096
MSIKEIHLEKESFNPGENLSQQGGEYTHIIISYDISGERYKVDNQINSAIENDCHLIKIDCVNTTLYWQVRIGDSEDSQEELNKKTKIVLKEKINEIFINQNDLSHEKANIFCMVGNIRAFAFEVDV